MKAKNVNQVGKYGPSLYHSPTLSDHQTRYSRCADNGFLEECISAGGERTTESRKCEAAAVACVGRGGSGGGGGGGGREKKEKKTNEVPQLIPYG